MPATFTPKQNEAIFARNATVLVSAAAGSGKTTVLIDRIYRLIKQGVRLNRMMIVTFTRAAAGEMRSRLNETLMRDANGSDETILRALDDLPNTKIGTLDSFCVSLLKQNFQEANVDPLFRMCEETQAAELFDLAWKDAMNELLTESKADAEKYADFLYLTRCYEPDVIHEMKGSRVQTIHSLTRKLYNFLLTLPHPFVWAKEKIDALGEKPYSDTDWYGMINKSIAAHLEELQSLLEDQQSGLQEARLENSKLAQTWGEDWTQLLDIQDAYRAGKPLGPVLAPMTLAKKKSLSSKEKTPEIEAADKQYKDARDLYKKSFLRLKELCCFDENELDTQIPVIQSMMRGLLLLTERTHAHFQEKKSRLNVLTYADLSQFAMELLSRPAMREAVSEEFDEIFVDECQDISEIQDAVIQALHNDHNHLFMVGDVKQSIYRFRNAEPGNFLHRMRSYSEDKDAAERAIFLQNNFRSTEPILEATNRVFRSVMHENITEMDYLPVDELIPGAPDKEKMPPVQIIDCGDLNETKTLDRLTRQGEIIAAEIERLLREKDKSGNYITYRDIAILMPKQANRAPEIQRALEERGIPVFCEKDQMTGELPEINLFLQILKLIQNPLQDLPLLAVLKMSPFLLTDSDLADIRLVKKGRNIPFYEAFSAACEAPGVLGDRCRKVQATLDTWRFKCRCMDLESFLWYLYGETGFYAEVGALPRGEARRGNLDILCREAATFEENGGTELSDFITQMENIQSGSNPSTAQTLSESDNVVRIMTVHKSKGLQFKVVFLPTIEESVITREGSGLYMNGKIGLCIDYIDADRRMQLLPFIAKGYQLKNEEEIRAEKARLLYVAMTRAKERMLILTWSDIKRDKLRHMKPGEARIRMAGSLEDWIMQAYFDRPDPDVWEYRTPVSEETEEQEHVNRTQAIQAWWKAAIESAPGEREARWEHIYDPVVQIPLKTSVSSIAKKQVDARHLPDNPTEETLEEKAAAEEIRRPLRLSDIPDKPAWLREKKLTGAARGTLFHEVLAQVNLQALRSEDLLGSVREQIFGLVDRRVLTQEEADHVDAMSIAAFFASPLGQRMRFAPEVHREWSFILMEQPTETIIQGVIDCAFLEEGAWVLFDYKTDHIVDEDAFIERYQLQLQLYAQALQQITGKQVKEKWLYSLKKNRGYRVE